MEYTVGGKYRVEEEIAIGGCGTVFAGVHMVAGKEVAIKVEPALARCSPLQQESRIYKTLQGGPGVPWMVWSGRSGAYNVMVTDLLGPSLEDVFRRCGRRFSLSTVLLLADQLLTRLEYIHSRGYVHRDVKPANFVLASHAPTEACVSVIDFGLAKRWRDPRTGAHIPYAQDPHHGVGTSLFASLNTHDGIESSRRDDLESLAYVLLYFARGTLPWRRTKGAGVRDTWARIAQRKAAAAPVLFLGLPPEFERLYAYARALEFADAPDYAGVRAMFAALAARVEGAEGAGAGAEGEGAGEGAGGKGAGAGGVPDWVRRPRHFDELPAEGEGAGVRRVRRCRACEAREEGDGGRR